MSSGLRATHTKKTFKKLMAGLGGYHVMQHYQKKTTNSIFRPQDRSTVDLNKEALTQAVPVFGDILGQAKYADVSKRACLTQQNFFLLLILSW